LGIILLFTLARLLAACASNTGSLEVLTKEGIMPYKLSENEECLLQVFGMEDKAQIISLYHVFFL